MSMWHYFVPNRASVQLKPRKLWVTSVQLRLAVCSSSAWHQPGQHQQHPLCVEPRLTRLQHKAQFAPLGNTQGAATAATPPFVRLRVVVATTTRASIITWNVRIQLQLKDLKAIRTAVVPAPRIALLRVDDAMISRAKTTTWSAWRHLDQVEISEPTLGTGSVWQVKHAWSPPSRS